MTQSANTTVAFANTEGNTDVVYLIRVKDATSTERTITWPSGMVWNGGNAPTLLNINDADEGQVFKLTTRDNGATWYGVEVVSYPAGFSLFGSGVGPLGNNVDVARSSPIQVGSGGGWYSVKGYGSAGSMMATKTDGTLWAWGSGRWGSIYPYDPGLGTYTNNSSPVQIPGNTWKHGVTTNISSMGVKTDGTLWAWGYNEEHGFIGDNSIISRSSPTQIPGTNWSTHVNGFSSSYMRSMAVKTDGTLWVWGGDQTGALGLNQPVSTKYSSPVQIPGTTWSQIAGGGSGGPMALKTDGTIWGWGSNTYGCLGLNQAAAQLPRVSSPVQLVGSTSNWVTISNGVRIKGAVNTSGELWVWGRNETGQLGQNNNIQYSSAVQIPGINWSYMIVGNYNDGQYVQAVKTDGTLWAWGRNTHGNLGLNNTTQYSSPIQVGSDTDWNTTVRGHAANSLQFYNFKS
jgi:alpha-tubulin suppressor-like RCC1 family protein